MYHHGHRPYDPANDNDSLEGFIQNLRNTQPQPTGYFPRHRRSTKSVSFNLNPRFAPREFPNKNNFAPERPLHHCQSDNQNRNNSFEDDKGSNSKKSEPLVYKMYSPFYKHHCWCSCSSCAQDADQCVSPRPRSVFSEKCSRCMSNKTSKGFLNHAECKYCTNVKNEGEEKPKGHKLHTDCKYCLDDMDKKNCEHKTEDEEDQGYYPHFHHSHRRRHVCNPHLEACQKDYYHNWYHDYGAHLPHHDYHDFYSRSFTDPYHHYYDGYGCLHGDPEFDPCEYCMSNGQTPVIYNSHSFRDGYGIVRCPLVREYNWCRGPHGWPHDCYSCAI